MSTSNKKLSITTFMRKVLTPLLTKEQLMQIYFIASDMQWRIANLSEPHTMKNDTLNLFRLQLFFPLITNGSDYISFYIFGTACNVYYFKDSLYASKRLSFSIQETSVKELWEAFYESVYA